MSASSQRQTRAVRGLTTKDAPQSETHFFDFPSETRHQIYRDIFRGAAMRCRQPIDDNDDRLECNFSFEYGNNMSRSRRGFLMTNKRAFWDSIKVFYEVCEVELYKLDLCLASKLVRRLPVLCQQVKKVGMRGFDSYGLAALSSITDPTAITAIGVVDGNFPVKVIGALPGEVSATFDSTLILGLLQKTREVCGLRQWLACWDETKPVPQAEYRFDLCRIGFTGELRHWKWECRVGMNPVTGVAFWMDIGTGQNFSPFMHPEVGTVED